MPSHIYILSKINIYVQQAQCAMSEEWAMQKQHGITYIQVDISHAITCIQPLKGKYIQ